MLTFRERLLSLRKPLDIKKILNLCKKKKSYSLNIKNKINEKKILKKNDKYDPMNYLGKKNYFTKILKKSDNILFLDNKKKNKKKINQKFKKILKIDKINKFFLKKSHKKKLIKKHILNLTMNSKKIKILKTENKKKLDFFRSFKKKNTILIKKRNKLISNLFEKITKKNIKEIDNNSESQKNFFQNNLKNFRKYKNKILLSKEMFFFKIKKIIPIKVYSNKKKYIQ